MQFSNDIERLALDVDFIDKLACTMAYTVNPIQLFKLMSFSELLEEQPICIEFYQDSDNYSSIRLFGFEHKI